MGLSVSECAALDAMRCGAPQAARDEAGAANKVQKFVFDLIIGVRNPVGFDGNRMKAIDNF